MARKTKWRYMGNCNIQINSSTSSVNNFTRQSWVKIFATGSSAIIQIPRFFPCYHNVNATAKYINLLLKFRNHNLVLYFYQKILPLCFCHFKYTKNNVASVLCCNKALVDKVRRGLRSFLLLRSFFSVHHFHDILK